MIFWECSQTIGHGEGRKAKDKNIERKEAAEKGEKKLRSEEEEEKWDLEPTKSEVLRSVGSILNDCINSMGNSLYLSEENELKPDKYLLSPRASYIMYELACYLVSGIKGDIKVIDPTIFIDIAEYFEAKSKLDIEEFKDSIKMYLYNAYIYKRHIDSKYRICMGYNGMDYLMYRILRCDN